MHLGLNVVQHLALGLYQDSHVQEDLVQVQQAALELLDGLVPLLDFCQCVQHLSEQERDRGSNDSNDCRREDSVRVPVYIALNNRMPTTSGQPVPSAPMSQTAISADLH